jgi:hypothetical protein
MKRLKARAAQRVGPADGAGTGNGRRSAGRRARAAAVTATHNVRPNPKTTAAAMSEPAAAMASPTAMEPAAIGTPSMTWVAPKKPMPARKSVPMAAPVPMRSRSARARAQRRTNSRCVPPSPTVAAKAATEASSGSAR